MSERDCTLVKISSTDECTRAVQFVRKVPLTLLVVVVLTKKDVTEESQEWNQFFSILQENLAKSKGTGNVCLLTLFEPKKLCIQFRETFGIKAGSSLTVLRYDGFVIDSCNFSSEDKAAEAAEMIVSAQSRLKEHFVQLFLSIISKTYEDSVSEMKASKMSSKLCTDLDNNESFNTLSADAWVAKKARPVALGRAKLLLKAASQDLQKPASKRIRLRIRLLDGKTKACSFASLDPLLEVFNVVEEMTGTHQDAFKLSTAYPRRSFLELEKYKNLKDLLITPDTLIVAEPIHGFTSVSERENVGILSYFFLWIMSLFQALLATFRQPQLSTSNKMGESTEFGDGRKRGKGCGQVDIIKEDDSAKGK
mmetsp:Transcript_8089/g.10537  ORF Transcript_8089/g.10537 Transcript_8089/m.10537 type:complete len:365 (-) Transcript_8089:185-1279(-)